MSLSCLDKDMPKQNRINVSRQKVAFSVGVHAIPLANTDAFKMPSFLRLHGLILRYLFVRRNLLIVSLLARPIISPSSIQVKLQKSVFVVFDFSRFFLLYAQKLLFSNRSNLTANKQFFFNNRLIGRLLRLTADRICLVTRMTVTRKDEIRTKNKNPEITDDFRVLWLPVSGLKPAAFAYGKSKGLNLRSPRGLQIRSRFGYKRHTVSFA